MPRLIGDLNWENGNDYKGSVLAKEHGAMEGRAFLPYDICIRFDPSWQLSFSADVCVSWIAAFLSPEPRS